MLSFIVNKWNLIFILVVATLCNTHEVVTYANNFGKIRQLHRKPIKGYRLNVVATLSQEVLNEDKCFLLCLHHPSLCVTFNVVDQANSGMKLCELLGVDGFDHQHSLEKDSNSIYFGVEVCYLTFILSHHMLIQRVV